MSQRHLELSSHRELLRSFLAEDLGSGDLTTRAIVPKGLRARGRIVAKAPMVLAGLEAAIEVFRLLDQSVTAKINRPDGAALAPNDEPALIRANAQALLSGERVALNLLQRLTGIATLARQYVEAVAGTPARIVDTRKTTPGIRALEKYAVTVGGAENHRRGLDDAILVKENHIRLAGGIPQAMQAVRTLRGEARFIEIEVTTIDEMQQALAQSPDMILLDNMPPEAVRHAVKLVRQQDGKILIEASGGITLANVRAYAEAGADWISVGALTHSAPAADLSLEIEPLVD
ncbi:MAG: carboxylating nicotinate-nucleotide diphosphorylase [Terriglobia bacterium]